SPPYLVSTWPPSHVFFFSYFCTSSVLHRALHSFPTRRSSDLHRRIGYGFSNLLRELLPTGQIHHPNRAAIYGIAKQKDFKILGLDRKSTRLNSSHVSISYAVFCLKKKKTDNRKHQRQNSTQEH